MATLATKPESGTVQIELYDGAGDRFQPGKHEVLFTVHGAAAGCCGV